MFPGALEARPVANATDKRQKKDLDMKMAIISHDVEVGTEQLGCNFALLSFGALRSP